MQTKVSSSNKYVDVYFFRRGFIFVVRMHFDTPLFISQSSLICCRVAGIEYSKELMIHVLLLRNNVL